MSMSDSVNNSRRADMIMSDSVNNSRRADMSMSDSESEEEELEDIMMMMQFTLRRKSIRSRKKNRRSIWVRTLFQKRNGHGNYHTLLQEMRLNDRESHFRESHFRESHLCFLTLSLIFLN